MNKSYLILFGFLLPLAAWAEVKKPNIVLFLVDDMGWQDTSVPFHAERTPFNDHFYFVQIAPYRYGGDMVEYTLPELWEAQTAAMDIPHTGMAVISDVGHVQDIHPRNKQDVGKRLALWALAKDYGQEDLVHSGPLYKSMAIEGSKIRLRFDHTGSGLASRDKKPLDWFLIAGENGRFVKAQAEIDGNTIVVSSDAIAKPTAARFAWHQEAVPNLINKEGLPAGPFRTNRP